MRCERLPLMAGATVGRCMVPPDPEHVIAALRAYGRPATVTEVHQWCTANAHCPGGRSARQNVRNRVRALVAAGVVRETDEGWPARFTLTSKESNPVSNEVIYRYDLGMEPNGAIVEVPTIEGTVVGVGRGVRGERAMWIKGDPDTLVLRRLVIVGTGIVMPPALNHLGWWAEPEYGWVWHLLEVADREAFDAWMREQREAAA